jgi:hypothetical protein
VVTAGGTVPNSGGQFVQDLPELGEGRFIQLLQLASHLGQFPLADRHLRGRAAAREDAHRMAPSCTGAAMLVG